MSLDERAQEELRSIFLVELGEHCQVLTHAFLGLEKEPDRTEQAQLLGEAFRAAHSLKGAARAVSLTTIETLAHALEETLSEIQHGRLRLTPALFDRLYAVVDSFGASADSRGTTGQPSAAVDDLLRQLQAVRADQASPTAAPTAPARLVPPRQGPAPVQISPSSVERTTPNRPLSPARRDEHLSGPADPSAEPDARLTPSWEQPVRDAGPETVRLPVARLDTLLEQLGELVIPRLELTDGLDDLAGLRQEVEIWQRGWRKVRTQLRQLDRAESLREVQPLVRFLEQNETSLFGLTAKLGQLHARLGGSLLQLRALTDDLQDDVKRLRMLPFGSIADGFGRVVRDLARSLGKDARLVLTGADTELDRQVLDTIKDSLLHLLRNALDHGIEDPPTRQRLGKPVSGSVALGAYQRGGSIVIEVEDDGLGLDAAAIRRAAADLRVLPAADLAAMADAEVLRLVFQPGLTTARTVSQLSGRGVGLDVVARTVERLGGRVDVQARPGHGTLFRITLPLTLATARALLLEAGGALYALHTSAVERVIRVDELRSVGGRRMLDYEGLAVPVASLAELLGARPGPEAGEPVVQQTVALIGAGSQRVGLIVDQLLGEQEIVVKPLGYPLQRVRYFSGATILGSGQVVPILNAGDLTRAAASVSTMVSLPQAAPTEQRRLRVLVADDSLTTRTLERYILEAAGYEVELAGDGVEAFSLLDERGYDVLVSDVDMPGLDGVALTVQVRQLPRFRELPIILVTSLASAEDRERGLQAGADAYMVKSSFDQDQLLRTIQELV